ncbi:MAG: hypothetical protein NXY57DRAFT_902023 [Lentinula lateritia]|uniref:Winged helix-turn helix domain-containing protein n=1 Tax=Lentinula lateritia TaxID=40482 RepID=A0ABQ8UZ00_9AGAR|nr:MAG: hypothetical protein NXY57DRAFT_902023 [Lentinula lateritia]KAJ4466359.1 hypothetical protein C8R41DRAFT_780564 [Lentinula lateritia]
MPRKRNIVRLRRHYSTDLKHRVLYQQYTLGKKTAAIAIDLNMPLRVVQRVLNTWNNIGEVCRDRRGQGRASRLPRDHCQHLVSLIEHSPDLYLDELQIELLMQYGIEVSIPTICRTLQRLGYSSKKLSKQAAERLDHKLTDFIMQIKDEPPNRIVCGDEAAVNIHTTYLENGWSMRGVKARKTAKFVRGKR